MPETNEPCKHAADVRDVTPSSPDSCLACVELGDRWVTLRLCLTCGHVGCCDSSKNKHASAHFRATGHAVMQSYEKEETWRYCFEHNIELPDAERPART